MRKRQRKMYAAESGMSKQGNEILSSFATEKEETAAGEVTCAEGIEEEETSAMSNVVVFRAVPALHNPEDAFLPGEKITSKHQEGEEILISLLELAVTVDGPLQDLCQGLCHRCVRSLLNANDNEEMTMK